MEKININKALSRLTKPEHPVLVITGHSGEKVNIMVAGWVMRTSIKPPLVAVSVGHARYTHEMLQKHEEFVLSYPVKGQETIIEFCGSRSGKDVDKFKELDIKVCSGEKIKLPVLREARVNLECKIVDKFRTGDHTIFIGEVLAASGNPKEKPLLNIGNYIYMEFEALPEKQRK